MLLIAKFSESNPAVSREDQFGWRWVLAPWVFGLGPWPYFVHGPRLFAWYKHPWFRVHPLVRRGIVRPHPLTAVGCRRVFARLSAMKREESQATQHD